MKIEYNFGDDYRDAICEIDVDADEAVESVLHIVAEDTVGAKEFWAMSAEERKAITNALFNFIRNFDLAETVAETYREEVEEAFEKETFADYCEG